MIITSNEFITYKNSIQQIDYEWKTLIQNQLIITNV